MGIFALLLLLLGLFFGTVELLLASLGVSGRP